MKPIDKFVNKEDNVIEIKMSKSLKNKNMKKLLFVIFLASLILLLGCKGSTVIDPIPVVPPVVKYTVEVISDTNGVISPSDKIISVVSGENLPLKISSNFGYKVNSLIVNGFPAVLTGNTSTVNYTLPNVEKNSKIEVVRGKSLSWYLTQNKWKCDSLINLEPDGRWVRYLLWGEPDAIQFVYTFLPDGSYNLYASGKFNSSGTWFVSGEDTKSPVLNLKENNVITVWKIEQLDEVYLTLFRDDIPLIGDPNHKFTSQRYKYSQLK